MNRFATAIMATQAHIPESESADRAADSSSGESRLTAWQEVESEVFYPGSSLAPLVGTIFLAGGVVGLLAIENVFPAGPRLWFGMSGSAFMAILGGAVFVTTVRRKLWPTHIRRAAPGVLPNVPTEPVALEGSIVLGLIPYELVEDGDSWQFRPSTRKLYKVQISMLAFGIPILTVLAGGMSWLFQSILTGTLVILFFGGAFFLVMFLVQRSGFRRLSCLTIPRNEGDFELETPELPDLNKTDLSSGLKWIFGRGSKRHQVKIPRDQLIAVQLCPWWFATGDPRDANATLAVQGSLVLAAAADGSHYRFPLLLTSDFDTAARLMQRLASTLNVPYIFGADAKGWSAEERRARRCDSVERPESRDSPLTHPPARGPSIAFDRRRGVEGGTTAALAKRSRAGCEIEKFRPWSFDRNRCGDRLGMTFDFRYGSRDIYHLRSKEARVRKRIGYRHNDSSSKHNEAPASLRRRLAGAMVPRVRNWHLLGLGCPW